MARKFYCSECGIELVLTRMAIPKKAVILDLIEPHVCEEKVDLEKKFSTSECLIYEDFKKGVKKTVQIPNDLDQSPLFDRRDRDYVKDTINKPSPIDLLNKISSQLKGD